MEKVHLQRGRLKSLSCLNFESKLYLRERWLYQISMPAKNDIFRKLQKHLPKSFFFRYDLEDTDEPVEPQNSKNIHS